MVRDSSILCGAAVCAAVAAWLSQSTFAVAEPAGPRIALLPLSPFALLIASGTGLAVVALARAGAALSPLWLLVLLLLPWLPFDVPAAFLTWSGRLNLLVWTAVGVLMIDSLRARRGALSGSDVAGPLRRFLSGRPRLAAALLSLLIFGTAAWQAAPSVPEGDEPHYLVITQSLLLDGDLRIENNHRRGDYEAYFPGKLEPHYIRYGQDGEIYSIHAPGISALVAPAFALGGHPAVVLFLLGLASAGGALMWHVGWLATRHTRSAWFGWAAVTVSATAIFQSFTVYPDGVGGIVVLTGFWALLRTRLERESGATSSWPWVLHGAALAMLPWLHTRFAVLAGSLGALVLLRLGTTQNPAGKAVAFLSVPAVSALSWIGFFIVIYGTPDPSAPYGTVRDFSAAFIPGGLAGLLFDQRFGLLANAPVLAFAFVGLALMLGARDEAVDRAEQRVSPASSRQLGLEVAFVVVAYLLTVTHYAMWWGGWSAPARLAAAVVPALAIPCAFAWSRLRARATRLTAAGTLVLTAFISTVLVVPGNGRLAFNTRDSYALWLDWAGRLADLGRGAPAWFRGREDRFFLEVAVWLVLLCAAWAVIRAVDRRPRFARREAFATTTVFAYACAAMLALSIVWRLNDVQGVTAAPAQLDFLRRIAAERRLLAVQVAPPGLLDIAGAPATMIVPGARFTGSAGAGRDDRPLLNVPAIPAGRYRVRPSVRGAGGRLMIGIGQDQFALSTEPIAAPPQPIVIDFPVDVRALIVRGDEDARRVVRAITIEPLSVVAAKNRLSTEFARRAVRYAGTAVFFLDDSSFPEPQGFWIGGARDAVVVLQPDRIQPRARLLLENAPVDNRLTITTRQWREELHLAPGDERRVEVPLDAARGATLLTFTASSGFRPSDADPESGDDRFLGVWVRLE